MKKWPILLLTASLQMSLCVFADTVITNGIAWTYTVSNGEASLGGNDGNPAISISTQGDIEVPSAFNGYKVSSIGLCAFVNCDGITNISLPSTVTSIGQNAFANCRGLITMSIPSSVTNIGNSAFSGCSSLTSITIPEGVARIEDFAFFVCQSLKDIEIPISVRSIGRYAFDGCDSLSISSDAGIKSISGWVIGYDNSTMPNSCDITFTGIRGIGDDAFSGCSKLRSVIIPDGVLYIGNNAFNNCGRLHDLVVANSVLDIGKYAFYGCASLSVFSMGNGVSNIKEGTFYGCSSLTNIVVAQGVKSIGDYAFMGCTNLRTIVLPSGVMAVGLGAFDGCTNIENATLPGWDCAVPLNNIKVLSISDGTTDINDGAFDNCSNLKQVSISETVMKIGDNAFEHCTNLEQINIPQSVTNIGSSAFNYCKSLQSLFIGDNVSTIEYGAFDLCSNLKEIIMGNSVSLIGKNSFSRCDNLSAITFVGNIPIGIAQSRLFSNPNIQIVRYSLKYHDLIKDVIPEGVEIDNHIFLTDTSNGWHKDFIVSHGDDASWRSGNISSNDNSSIEIWVNGAGRISFWWKSSSEEYAGEIFDYAYLSVDGVPQGRVFFDEGSARNVSEGIVIGGLVDWTNIVLDVNGEGAHTIRWTYCKDDVDEVNVGEDCVWLDEFSFLPKPTVSFNIGANASGDTPDSVQDFTGANITLPNDERFYWIDHVFDGWTDGASNYTAEANFVIPATNVTLTAHWLAKSFVSFGIGNGTGETPSMIKALPDEIVSLPTGEGLTLTDYAFGGWTDGAANYAAGDNYIVPETNVTLTAVWIAKRFLTFTLDGGDGEIPITIKDVPNATVTLPSGVGLSKPKYTFVGWSDGAQTYEAGAEYVVTDSSIEFSAVWEANLLDAPVITSTDVVNGGTIETASATIEISADNGAAIYYTLDGATPTTNSIPYVVPFMSDGMSVTIRAFAVKDNYFDSGVAEFSFNRKPYSAAECINANDKTVSTGGNDTAWVRVLGEAAHDGVAALCSGEIGDGESSSIEMTVDGAGEIGYWWKSSSEISRNRKYDYVSFLIDGVEHGWLGGEKDWTNEVFSVSGEGTHTLKWVYTKNDNGLTQGEDCVWLDEVKWTPWREITTKQTAVPIPYGWLESHGLLTNTDAETAAKQLTGKRDGSGRLLTVEDDFIAGTDPTNGNDIFTVSIIISNGVPVVEWKPNLNTNDENRVYTIYGKESLNDEEWMTPTNSLCRFFKVGVAMPTKEENHDSTGGDNDDDEGGNESGGGNGEGNGGDDTGNMIPSGYSTNDVQCVSCTGSQWYDLGLPPTLTMRTQIKCSLAGENEHMAIIGVLPSSYNENDKNDYRLFIASSPFEWFLDFPGSSRIRGASAALNEVREVEFGNFYVKDLVTDSMLISGSTVTAPCPSHNIRLFRTNYNNPSKYTTGSVYYVRIYDLNASDEYELVRNLVPCKSDADEVGLLDLVEKKFYKSDGTNVSLVE